MQIIQKEITRHDFEKTCKLNNLEYFTLEQVEAWVKDNKSLIEKSQTEELDDIEKSLVDEFTVTASNLNLVSVLNDDLTKSVMYVRPSQIDWDKDENGDLMKAKSGTYSDTPENRKLGRVGQKYGGSKGEEKKEEPKKTEEQVKTDIFNKLKTIQNKRLNRETLSEKEKEWDKYVDSYGFSGAAKEIYNKEFKQ